jgi:hypothetical protein
MNIRKIIKEEVDDFGWADTPNYIPIEDFVSCVVCDGDYVRVTKRAGVDIFGLKYVPEDSGDNVLEDGEYEIYRNNLGHSNSQWIELVGPKDGNVQQYSFFVDISEMDSFWFEQIPSPYQEEELNESELDWIEDTPLPDVYVGKEFTESPKFYINADDTVFHISKIEDIDGRTVVWIMGDGLDSPVDVGIDYVIDGFEKGEYLPVD